MNNLKLNTYLDFDNRLISFDNQRWTRIPEIDSLPLAISLSESRLDRHSFYKFGDGFYNEIEFSIINKTTDTNVDYPHEFNLLIQNDTDFTTYLISEERVHELLPNRSIRFYLLYMNPYSFYVEPDLCGNLFTDVEYVEWEDISS